MKWEDPPEQISIVLCGFGTSPTTRSAHDFNVPFREYPQVDREKNSMGLRTETFPLCTVEL